MVALEVASVDKQGQRFYPGSGPSCGGNTPTSCLSVIAFANMVVTKFPARC